MLGTAGSKTGSPPLQRPLTTSNCLAYSPVSGTIEASGSILRHELSNVLPGSFFILPDLNHRLRCI